MKVNDLKEELEDKREIIKKLREELKHAGDASMHMTATLHQERPEMRELPIIAEAVEEEEVVP
jgi:hypothetical protein